MWRADRGNEPQRENVGVGIVSPIPKSGNGRPAHIETPCRFLTASIEELERSFTIVRLTLQRKLLFRNKSGGARLFPSVGEKSGFTLSSQATGFGLAGKEKTTWN